ncbi:MAG: hypothetical protein Kow00127_22650 [Bacteroidales bacterium]
MGLFSKKSKKEKGMAAINSHKGKKKVYETYKKKDPEMAEAYLEFHQKNPDATYIVWDKKKGKFTS